MRRSEARRLLRRRLRGNVSGSPANGFVIPVHAAVCIAGRPAGLVLKQADSANPPVPAKIEPVQRAARYANQISSFHFDRCNRPLRRTDVEPTAPGDDVTDFVLILRI